MEFINICTQRQHFNSLVKHHPKTFIILLPHPPSERRKKKIGSMERQSFKIKIVWISKKRFFLYFLSSAGKSNIINKKKRISIFFVF